MGFGGSSPCAQTHGQVKFIESHPKDILIEHIQDPNHVPKNGIFGANKHEGSFVLGSEWTRYDFLLYNLYYSVIYNSYILPNNVTSDSHFLRYDFTEKMLDALGIKDSTGVIYELINYRYFTEDVLGIWDLMIDGMVNVRFP